jgi:N-acetylmuramic acid 6-phosphate etherase
VVMVATGLDEESANELLLKHGSVRAAVEANNQ